MSADRGFVDWRPQRRTRDQIDQIMAILARYEHVLPLTLRQLFYILVAAESIAKTTKAYRALGYTVRKARRAKLLEEDAGAFSDAFGADVTFTRLALTEAQVALYHLPAAPPEMTGGRLTVQAEALPPDVLADLVDGAIRERLDLDRMGEVAERSARIRADFEAKLRAAGLWNAP